MKNMIIWIVLTRGVRNPTELNDNVTQTSFYVFHTLVARNNVLTILFVVERISYIAESWAN